MTTIRTLRRVQLGLTQNELASYLGKDQSWLSRLEAEERRGRPADARTVLAVEALCQRKAQGLPLDAFTPVEAAAGAQVAA